MILRSILAVAAAFVFPAMAAAQVTVAERLDLSQPVVVEATLGAEGHFVEGGFPEVSLAALEHAISIGADQVRLPSHLTKDGHYVLMYGIALNATTNVEDVFPEGAAARYGKVSGERSDYIEDYTLEEIRTLALTGGSDGGVHPVPTLEEALAIIDGRVLGRIRLMAYDLDALEVIFETYGIDGLMLSTAVDERWLEEASAATGVKVSVSLAYARDPVAKLEAFCATYGPALAEVSTRFLRTITPNLLAKAEELGVRVKIWQGAADNLLTAGDSAPWEAALASGATSFETAHPTLLLEMLGR